MTKVRIIPQRTAFYGERIWRASASGDHFHYAAYGAEPYEALALLKRRVIEHCAAHGHRPPRWALWDAVV